MVSQNTRDPVAFHQTFATALFGLEWHDHLNNFISRQLTYRRSVRILKKVKQRVFKLGRFGDCLWNREKGRQVRVQLRSQMENLAQGDVLIVDADGVEAFDYSFADEVFVKMVKTLVGEHPGRFVVIENLNDCTKENLTKALENANLAMIERCKGKLKLVGKVHPADEETFEQIAKSGEAASAASLGRRLDMNLTAMNERLSKLTNLGVVRREKGSSASGREQYVYHVLS